MQWAHPGEMADRQGLGNQRCLSPILKKGLDINSCWPGVSWGMSQIPMWILNSNPGSRAHNCVGRIRCKTTQHGLCPALRATSGKTRPAMVSLREPAGRPGTDRFTVSGRGRLLSLAFPLPPMKFLRLSLTPRRWIFEKIRTMRGSVSLSFFS